MTKRERAAPGEAGAARAVPRRDRRVPRRSRFQRIARTALPRSIREELADAVVAELAKRVVLWLRTPTGGSHLFTRRRRESPRKLRAASSSSVEPIEKRCEVLPPLADDISNGPIRLGDIPDLFAVVDRRLACVGAVDILVGHLSPSDRERHQEGCRPNRW